MTCPEMGAYYHAMTNDMGQKLSGYAASLQGRFGDPRVAAAQEAQMRQQQAAAMHAATSYTSALKKPQYDQSRAGIKATHDARMSKRMAQGKRPGSAQPAKDPAPRPTPARPSRAKSVKIAEPASRS